MPILETKVIEVTLPSYPDSKVSVYEKAPFGLIADLTAEMGNLEIAKILLPQLIVGWNFTDKDNKELPITLGNIMMLPIEDVNFLLEKALEHMQATLKKKI